MSLDYSITTTWNGGALDHAPVSLSLSSSPDQQQLILTISAPFFNDPPSPAGPPGQPFYGLWDYEVVEAFFLNDANQYLEVEVCPWGQHIVLLLSGQRVTVRHSLQLEVSTQRGGGVWSGTAAIPVSYLPEKVTKFNAYAIHGSGEARVYEALYPAPSTAANPDFHALQYFKPIDLSGLLPSQATDSMSQLWSDSLQGLFRYDIATTWDDVPLSPPVVQVTLQGFEAGVELNVTAPFYNDPAPDGTPGEPFYGLWDYEVVEMFFLNKNDEYLEVELGPWGQHLLLLLQGERNAIKDSLPLDYIVTEKTDPVGSTPGLWKGSAMIPPGYFPPNVTLVNAYAIHGVGEARQYQALYPAPNNDPNYPSADFHRLDLFRAIDFEFQVRDNKDYSQVWLDAIGSGASPTTQPVIQDAGEMTTIGLLRSIQTITPEPSDTLAPESVDADPEATATLVPKDNTPETTITPEPANITLAVAFPSVPRESPPEFPLPTEPEDKIPDTTITPESADNTPAVAFSSEPRESPPKFPLPEDNTPEITTAPEPTEISETTFAPKLDKSSLKPILFPGSIQRESVPEIPLPPPEPEVSTPEPTTTPPEEFRESGLEITLPPKTEATDPEPTTVAPEPLHRESVPKIPLPPRPENSDPEPTTLAPEPITSSISSSGNTLESEPAETLPSDSTDTVGQKDNEAAPQNPTTMPPTTPAPTTLPEPLEDSKTTLSPGNTRTTGRRRPRPQRVNHDINSGVVAPQNLPVRSRGHPVPHPLRVRPNRRVGEHGLPPQGLPLPIPGGGLHPEDFLAQLGQHLLSQHQGLEFPPPQGQTFRSQHNQQRPLFPRDQQFQPPRDQQFQPPRGLGFQPPRDQQFQPPRGQGFQPPRDQQFQPATDQQSQPPISQPEDQAFRPPKDKPLQPPTDQQFQPPRGEGFQPPADQQFQPPTDQQFQPPADQQFQPPVSQPIEPPKDQEFQIPEDRQSQPSDQPLSAPQQEVQEQPQRRPTSGGLQQHQFPPSRGGGVSLGGAGEEEVGLQEVEEVITSLTEGSSALPPPHPLCFTPGLVPDERRCWVFHECELLDGQWQVYSWKCIRGHVFDPFNVACVPGRCRRRRRG
ncbi:uncharacterized protein LOC127001687 isoform X2 [Eriocheir sinensis]|uniref:uncharacterized protein LOC127001687 isoform X2 n=1 Tax=Eriocheir sinensis TaxID=95602 RepID=UPI0021C5E662|nr:uncharacterized protein LOC127001687 isoform X2 [Eriocheir sinensis]